MSDALADLTFTDVQRRAGAGAVLAVPLGATEQHGAHLPLSTDTDIAAALCTHLARVRSDVVVAPPMPFGASGEHAGFAGTLSIGREATELVVLELGRSAFETFDHVIFVSAHGGNSGPVNRAVTRLRDESRDAELFQPTWAGLPGDDPHAGHIETSVQLVLRPGAVRVDRAKVGDVRPLARLMPALRTGGVLAVTATGVLGDPTTATARAGRAVLDRLYTDLERHVAAWRDTA